MKAITIHQPWASLLFAGLPDANPPKQNETRTRPYKHRGPLAIHAGKTTPHWIRQMVLYDQDWPGILAHYLRENQAGDFHLDEIFDALPRGQLLGTVYMFDCLQVRDMGFINPIEFFLGSYPKDGWAYLFKDQKKLITPIPWKGKQGLWNLPDSALEGALFHE